MRARLRGISSSDIPEGRLRLPDDPSNCWVVIDAEIGPADESGADFFTFYVCTPARLSEVTQSKSLVFGRHMIIMDRFDWVQLESAIGQILEGIEQANWEAVARMIGRYGLWEFEDYQA